MSGASPGPVVLSVVIPVYNERDNLAPLLEEVESVMRGLGRPYEVLFVDDGSTDGSDRVLRELRAARPEVRVVTLARNAGQTAAMDAGFRRARGEVVVTLDADLQNDPADIPRVLDALEGWDAVVGVRTRRQDSLVRRLSSRVANYVRNRLSDETKMEGYRVRETAVGHRPRKHGASKYGIGNRLLPSFQDLLAVRWMKRRKLRYEVKDDS